VHQRTDDAARRAPARPGRREVVAGLVLTAAVTAFLVAADLLHRLTGGLASAPTSRWKIDEDGSWAEITAGGAMLVAAVLLARRARADERSAVLWVWAAVLVVVTADDLLRLHETGGAAVVDAARLGPALGLDAQGWGELAVWGALGAVSFAALTVTFLRSGAPARRVSLWLLACTVVLGVSAVGVDMLAIVVEPSLSGAVSWVVAMLESAGELAAAGLFATTAWYFRRPTASTVPAERSPHPVTA
jgi:hypothetical protein